MIERFLELADIKDGTLLDAAVMTEDGLEEWRYERANTCENSHSSTKLFTSVCVGMLWDEGVLSLDEKATVLFPGLWPADMDPRWHDVTVENALRHEIGFEDSGVDLEGEAPCGGGETDPLTLIFRAKIVHEPGTFYKYSDAAFYLLSRVVEQKTGMTLEQFIRRRLGVPMGFRDFALASCPMGHSMGGGCLYMRAGDMVKLGYMLACGGVYGGRRILSQAYIDKMRERCYALNHYRETGGGKGIVPEEYIRALREREGPNYHESEIFIKTGAFGQGIAFSGRHRIAAAWHRTAYCRNPDPDRNSVTLCSFDQLIRECFGS